MATITDKIKFSLTAIKDGCLSTIKSWCLTIKELWLKHWARISWVFAAAAAGVWLAVYSRDIIDGLPFLADESTSASGSENSTSRGTVASSNDSTNARIKSGIFFILLVLPLSFCLWLFRNHDKREQIKQAEENNRFNTFSHATRLFLDGDKGAKAVGLKLLLKLKERGLFVKEFNLITPNADLQGVNLRGVDLSGIDLSGANLSYAFLEDAILDETIIEGALLAMSTEENAFIAFRTFSRKEMEEFLKAELPDKAMSLDFEVRIIEHEGRFRLIK